MTLDELIEYIEGWDHYDTVAMNRLLASWRRQREALVGMRGTLTFVEDKPCKKK